MNIYLASAYSRYPEMQEVAKLIEAQGHVVTSRWIRGDHDTPPSGVRENSPDHFSWCAREDLDDIYAADCIVSVLGPGRRNSGGRHVEFGIGVATGKSLIVVGLRENVFHHLDYVAQVDDIDGLIDLLGNS